MSELRAVLPAEVFAALDTGALVLEPDHFVEPELSELESDLLFSVPLRGKPAYVYVLVEHQSTPDPLMPWRMLQYLTKVWKRVLENGPVRRLPAILPVVVAHVERGWNAPTRFLDVLDIDEPLRGAIGPFIPDFRFLLDDLARVSDEELRAKREATAFARLVWFLLKHGRSSDNLLAGLEEWVGFLGELPRDPAHPEDFLSLLVYIRTVTDVPADRLRAFLCEHVGPEMEENMSAVEMMLEANRHKWIAEGKAEGKAEGAKVRPRVRPKEKLVSS